jgi:hypothetical protein
MAAATSATIARIDYDAQRLRLTIVFRDGPAVVHIGVPSGVHAAFVAAAHQGAYYAEHIKNTYRLA